MNLWGKLVTWYKLYRGRCVGCGTPLRDDARAGSYCTADCKAEQKAAARAW